MRVWTPSKPRPFRVERVGHPTSPPPPPTPLPPGINTNSGLLPPQSAQQQKTQPAPANGAGLGVTGGGTVALGVGKAAAAATLSGDLVVTYNSDQGHPTVAGGASGGVLATAGSHVAGHPHQEPSNTAVGGFIGAGVGITFGNFGNAQALKQPSETLSFDVGFVFGGSIQLSISNGGFWAASVTVGPAFGLAVTDINTSTAAAGTQ